MTLNIIFSEAVREQLCLLFIVTILEIFDAIVCGNLHYCVVHPLHFIPWFLASANIHNQNKRVIIDHDMVIRVIEALWMGLVRSRARRICTIDPHKSIRRPQCACMAYGGCQHGLLGIVGPMHNTTFMARVEKIQLFQPCIGFLILMHQSQFMRIQPWFYSNTWHLAINTIICGHWALYPIISAYPQ